MNETYPKLGKIHAKFHKNYNIPQFKNKLFQGHEEAGISSKGSEAGRTSGGRESKKYLVSGYSTLNLVYISYPCILSQLTTILGRLEINMNFGGIQFVFVMLTWIIVHQSPLTKSLEVRAYVGIWNPLFDL